MKLNSNQLSVLNTIVADKVVRIIDLSSVYTATLASLLTRDLIKVITSKGVVCMAPTVHAKHVLVLNKELTRLNKNYRHELHEFAVNRRAVRGKV